MNQLNIDLGMEEFDLGYGVLRFNPADPGLYARFAELEPGLARLQQELNQGMEQAKDAVALLKLLEETDRQFKQLLSHVFGEENDFSRLLAGVNLLAVAGNGMSVAENLLASLEPVLTRGAERFVNMQTQAALEKARLRREKL